MVAAEIADHVFRQLRVGSEPSQTAAYVAVPGNEMARWMLPAGRPEIGRVLASWAPFRLRSRAAWSALRAASQLGRIARLPGVSVLELETRGADWTSLGWRGDEPPIPVIYLGTPGPKRKAVVHLVEPSSGLCRAVVKVPLTDEAKTAILHEAEVLEALARERYEFSPRLLQVDWTRGIATQTFVDGRPGSRRLTPECRQLLQSLLLAGEITTLAEHGERWDREISEVADESAEHQTIAAVIDELRDDSPLPACWEHGDFAPWNIKRLPAGGCALLDWEDGRRKALPLQDAYHFLHMQDWLFGKKATLHAADVWEFAVGMKVPPGLIRKLEGAYLVSAYLKCVGEGNCKRARFVSSTIGLLQRKVA